MQKEEKSAVCTRHEKEIRRLSKGADISKWIYPDPTLKIVRNNHCFTDVEVIGPINVDLVVCGNIHVSELLSEYAFLGRTITGTGKCQTEDKETRIVRFHHEGILLLVTTDWQENEVESDVKSAGDTCEISLHKISSEDKKQQHTQKDTCCETEKAACQGCSILACLLGSAMCVFFFFLALA